jgi:hypothetical protein
VRKSKPFILLLGALLFHAVAQAQQISYSTYLGTAGAQESINDIKVDSAGNAYVAYDVYDDTGPGHIFMASKIGPGGGIGYTTVVGDFHSEATAKAIAVDDSGNAYVTGWAYSYPSGHPRFPTLNALQSAPAGGVDAVVVKLSPQGQVVFSTYLGGSGDDQGRAIALDSAGNIYIAGTTTSNDFPILNPYQALRIPGGASGTDLFITKLDPSGSTILYSTYLGGNDDDTVTSIAVDSSGIYLAGSTKSSSFAGRPNLPGVNWSGYAVKFNAAGNALVYTLVWSDPHQDHIVVKAALHSSGMLYIGERGQLRKLNAPGTAFLFSRSTTASLSSIALDSQGNLYATGRTTSSGGASAFVTKIPVDGGPSVYAVSLNGTIRNLGDASVAGSSAGTAIAVSPAGAVYVGGFSESFNFPTTNGSTRSRWTAASSQDAIFFVVNPD